MKKQKVKAIIYTILLMIIITSILTVSHFIETKFGFKLYTIIIEAIAYVHIGEGIDKFYNKFLN